MGRRGPWCQRTREEPGCIVAGITMDAGGLIAVDRNDRRIVVLLARARETGSHVTVPASALAQAVRQPQRQAPSGPAASPADRRRHTSRPS